MAPSPRSSSRRSVTGSRPGGSNLRRMDDLWVCHLGTVEYRAGVALQERLRERVSAGEVPGVRLLLEHPPTYTLGRRTTPDALPLGEDWARAQGIDVVR